MKNFDKSSLNKKSLSGFIMKGATKRQSKLVIWMSSSGWRFLAFRVCHSCRRKCWKFQTSSSHHQKFNARHFRALHTKNLSDAELLSHFALSTPLFLSPDSNCICTKMQSKEYEPGRAYELLYVFQVRSASISMRQAICYVGERLQFSRGFCLRGKICFHGLINVISWLDCSASICNNYPWPNNATQYAVRSLSARFGHLLHSTHSTLRWREKERGRDRKRISLLGANKKQYAFLCTGLCMHRGTTFWYSRIPYSHIEHHSISNFINKSSQY